jgi:hypothetical protein
MIVMHYLPVICMMFHQELAEDHLLHTMLVCFVKVPCGSLEALLLPGSILPQNNCSPSEIGYNHLIMSKTWTEFQPVTGVLDPL